MSDAVYGLRAGLFFVFFATALFFDSRGIQSLCLQCSTCSGDRLLSMLLSTITLQPLPQIHDDAADGLNVLEREAV